MLKVVIIDDDKSIVYFLQRLIQKNFEAEVLIAYDGISGFSLVKKEKPDLVFCDLNMPGMSGIEVVDSVRNTPDIASTQIVILSSMNNRNYIARVFAQGVKDYILKPLFSEEIQNRLMNTVKMSVANKRITDKGETSQKLNDRKKILIADKDINFRDFFKKIVGIEYTIIEAINALDAFKKFVTESPEIVVLTNNLEGMNEVILAKKIKSLKSSTKTDIYLLVDSNYRYESSEGLFSGRIVKSANSDEFKKQLIQLFEGKTIGTQFVNQLKTATDKAISQAIASYLGEEVETREITDTVPLNDYLYCILPIRNNSCGYSLSVEFLASKTGIEDIALKVLKKEIKAEDIFEVLNGLLNIIVMKLKESIAQSGEIIETSNPKISKPPDDFWQKKHDIALTINFESDYQFIFVVTL